MCCILERVSLAGSLFFSPFQSCGSTHTSSQSVAPTEMPGQRRRRIAASIVQGLSEELHGRVPGNHIVMMYYNSDDIPNEGAGCRISVPYPFQWGAPTFDAGECFAMMMTSFIAIVEVCLQYLP